MTEEEKRTVARLGSDLVWLTGMARSLLLLLGKQDLPPRSMNVLPIGKDLEDELEKVWDGLRKCADAATATLAGNKKFLKECGFDLDADPCQ